MSRLADHGVTAVTLSAGEMRERPLLSARLTMATEAAGYLVSTHLRRRMTRRTTRRIAQHRAKNE